MAMAQGSLRSQDSQRSKASDGSRGHDDTATRTKTRYPEVLSVGTRGHDDTITSLFHGAVAKVLLGGFEVIGTVATIWTYGKQDGLFAPAAGVLVFVRSSKGPAQGDKPFEAILPMTIGGSERKRDFKVDKDFTTKFLKNGTKVFKGPCSKTVLQSGPYNKGAPSEQMGVPTSLPTTRQATGVFPKRGSIAGLRWRRDRKS